MRRKSDRGAWYVRASAFMLVFVLTAGTFPTLGACRVYGVNPETVDCTENLPTPLTEETAEELKGTETPAPSEGEEPKGTETETPSEGEETKGTETPSEGEETKGTETPAPSEGEETKTTELPLPKALIQRAEVSGRAVRLRLKAESGAWSGYEIFRASSRNGKYKRLGICKGNSYRDSGRSRNRTYYYRVCACRAETGGLKSGQLSTIKAVTVPLKTVRLRKKDVTSSACRLSWKKVSGAKGYRLYRSVRGKAFKCIKKKVKRNAFLDTKLRPNTIYRYKLRVIGRSNTGVRYLSEYSSSLKLRTRKRAARIVYVGDSVMSGMESYNIVREKNRRVIAKIGVSPYTFYNNAIMDKLLDYRPDRMFIMLGMNALEGAPSARTMDSVLTYYKKIIVECRSRNSDMEIIVLSVSPTRPSASVKNTYINRFNSRLKSMAGKLKLRYYDYTAFLRDKDGNLRAEYAERDGIHWKISGYRRFKDALDHYMNKL